MATTMQRTTTGRRNVASDRVHTVRVATPAYDRLHEMAAERTTIGAVVVD